MTQIGLLGCGGWGKNLARNLKALGVLKTIADPADAAANLAQELGVAHVASPEDILNDPAVEAVVIATPAVTHAPLAAQALAAGKHVYVEKPIALSVVDAIALAEQAKQKGKVLMVGHLLQYHAAFLHLLEMCRSGALGEISHIISNRLNFGLIRSEENVLWSFSPHDLSMVLALASRAPISVKASGQEILQKGIPDIFSTELDFGDGLTAIVNASWLHPQKEQKLMVIGDAAMAVFDDRQPWPNKLAIHDNKVAQANGRMTARAGDVHFVDIAQSEPLRAEMQHFLDCIRTGATPRTDAAEATRVLSVLDAAQRSYDTQGAPCAPANGVA
jgi:UDP-2-acetamido-3-amino-2,3-dideoxy-glucuronate N-acetyltransferase